LRTFGTNSDICTGEIPVLSKNNSEQKAAARRLSNRGPETAVAEQVITGDLIAAADAGDDALEQMVREHARLVYRVAYSVVRDHHDAEDVTQETFVRVLRWRKKLAAVRDVKSWIARIAWRLAVDRIRKKPQLALEELDHDIAKSGASSVAAEESVLAAEMSALLGRLIVALPGQLRDVITLSTVQELSPSEIGEVLGIPESAVRSRQFRAREILKDKIASLLEGKRAR
jgi:RNA polymerase sigma-70 factor (ECF subfamily)